MHAILIWKFSLNFILYYIMNRAFILKLRDIKPQNNNYIDIKTMAFNSLVHPQCWMCISSLEPIHQRRYTQNWQVQWRASRISNDYSTYTVELWSLELICLEHHGSLELVRQSHQFLYVFNAKRHPRFEQAWLKFSNTKHGPQSDFLM